MLEPSTVVLIVGLATLLVERLFSWGMKVKSSHCMGNEIVMKEECLDNHKEINQK